MKQRFVALTIAFLGLLLACSIQIPNTTAQTPTDIHILPDGTVTPPTTPIHQNGNTYQLTGNINTTITIERNNMVLDGQGFTIQGLGNTNSAAINLTCTGTTVKNLHISGWQVGVLGAYDNNKVEGNEFTSNTYDIAVYGNNYEISQNYLCYVRIQAANIHVYENKFQTRTYGSAFWISNSTNITIEANEFTFTSQTTSFVSIDSRSTIQVYHNNFLSQLLDSRGQAYLFGMSGISDMEPWDDGYPSGGNYWSDFSSRYGNASMIDNSGIWDTAYVIESYGNVSLLDRYPLYNPYEIHVAALPTPPPAGSIEDSPAPSVPELPIWTALALLVAAALAVACLKRKTGSVQPLYGAT